MYFNKTVVTTFLEKKGNHLKREVLVLTGRTPEAISFAFIEKMHRFTKEPSYNQYTLACN